MDKQTAKELPKTEDSDESMESDDEEEAAMENREYNRNFIETSNEMSPHSFLMEPMSDLKSEDPITTFKLDSHEFNPNELNIKLSQMQNLVILELNKCSMKENNHKFLPPISTLKEITFNNCLDNIFYEFSNQNSLEKITIMADTTKWNGFPHDALNKMCEYSRNINHIILKGAGTGGYFDCDDFPYKITKLESTMITHHWYIGLTEAPIKFLQVQKESLKELTINELPYDFKGGEVLKYIIEEMNLDTFHYGKIPLILNGQKQKVKEFTATEIQITSAFEIIRQFECDKFILNLSNTDIISSDEVEKITNPATALFDNLKEFEVIDNSSSREIFGIFMGLYKNLKNICKLTLKTQDRNINTILESLPIMHNLEEIQLTSTIPEASESYKIIKEFAPNLKIVRVADNNIGAAQNFFGEGIDIFGIEEHNDPADAIDPPEEEEANELDNNGDDDEDESFEGFTPGIVNQGNIVARTRPSTVHSSFDQDLNDIVFSYRIHAFGYYKNILNQRNLIQLEGLLGHQYSQNLGLRTELGKICVRFQDNTVENRNTLKAKLKKLAYIQMDQTIQLPLIITSTDERIRVSCTFKTDASWDRFLIFLSQSNEISGSLWILYRRNEVLVGGELNINFIFDVDARSYTKIQEMNSTLIYERTNVTITEVDNPYTHDILQLHV